MRMILGLILLLIVMTAFFFVFLHFFPQITFRSMPKGFMEAQLPEDKPNWVSSHVSPTNKHYVAPLPVRELVQLANCMKKNISRIHIDTVSDEHLIAYRQSHFCRFVDWITIDNKGQVTSSATLGYYDFEKNRELVEQIRAACGQSTFA